MNFDSKTRDGGWRCCSAEFGEHEVTCPHHLDFAGKTVELPCFGIKITLNGQVSGTITSDLHEDKGGDGWMPPLPTDAPGSRHKNTWEALCDRTSPRTPTGGSGRTWGHTAPSSALLNPIMIFTWDEILPAAIERLPPLHRELIRYVMLQPGRQRPSYTYANERWGLGREQFEAELGCAFAAIRQYLGRYGIMTAVRVGIRWKSRKRDSNETPR
jgi:hypothetical protein